jgi:hypothetical protein
VEDGIRKYLKDAKKRKSEPKSKKIIMESDSDD